MRAIGEPIVTVNPTRLPQAPRATYRAADRITQIQDLVAVNPYLAPATFLLPQLAQVSEAVIDATILTDPLTTTLLALGKAAKLEIGGYHKKTIDIAAVASGPNADVVRLISLNEKPLKWQGHEGAQFSTPTFVRTEQVLWAGMGTSIQQICFSEGGDESGDWLAIRAPGVISILKPVMRVVPVYSNTHVGSSGQRLHNEPSRLDANCVLALTTTRTGGAAHVDFAFNPWNARQFAILDAEGCWSTWTIEDRANNSSFWSLQAGSSGQVLRPDKADETIDNADGWGTVIWVRNGATIVAASRRTVALYCTTSPSRLLKSSLLDLDSVSDWVLDIRRSPFNVSQIFVLTTVRIFWLNVSSYEEESARFGHATDKTLLSGRHFRSPHDISLQLHLTGSVEGIEIHVRSAGSWLIGLSSLCVSL